MLAGLLFPATPNPFPIYRRSPRRTLCPAGGSAFVWENCGWSAPTWKKLFSPPGETGPRMDVFSAGQGKESVRGQGDRTGQRGRTRAGKPGGAGTAGRYGEFGQGGGRVPGRVRVGNAVPGHAADKPGAVIGPGHRTGGGIQRRHPGHGRCRYGSGRGLPP